MKKIIILAITFILPFAFSSCDEETEGISRITNFPLIELNGSGVVLLEKGGSFADPGATATENGNPIDLTTSSNLNTDAVGVYTINYRAINVDGFSASRQRLVVVTPANPNTEVDLTGMYKREGFEAFATWTKVAPGVYVNSNVGGVVAPSPAVLPVYVFHYDDGTMTIPAQPVPNGYGTLSATIELTADGYALTVSNIGFGTALRTFKKL